MFHRLLEGFEGEPFRGVGMQCQSNGDCTGFNLTTKMIRKEKKKTRFAPILEVQEQQKKQRGLRDSFFFLLDWCYVVCFSYFLHMRDSCLLF